MKYIRSFYLVLVVITISGSAYAFVDTDRGTLHRNLGYQRGPAGGGSNSPQLW